MSRAATVRQAEVTRALKAAVAAGMRPTGYTVDPDGTIHVSFDQRQLGTGNSFDEIMGGAR